MSASKETAVPKDEPAQGPDRSLPWYREDIGVHLSPTTREMFRVYCSLSDSDLESHLQRIRNLAWSVRQYPCIGQWGFLEPGIFHSSEYETVVMRLKQGHSFLDIGCCLGQDLRRLALDGAPTEKMYASDIVPDFWEIGFDLFQDRASMKAQFVQADILDQGSTLGQLEGKIDVIYLGSVLHLFGWEGQLQAAKQVARLAKVGTIVLGCQIGTATPEEIAPTWRDLKSMYRQSVESFKQLWEQVARETDTSWAVESSLKGLETLGLTQEDIRWMREGTLLLQFTVCRKA